MSIDNLTDGITFCLSFSAIVFECINNVFTGLEKYANQIDTRRYGDYKITDCYFCKHSPIQRSIDTKLACASLFQTQHKHTKKILIPLCKYFTDI